MSNEKVEKSGPQGFISQDVVLKANESNGLDPARLAAVEPSQEVGGSAENLIGEQEVSAVRGILDSARGVLDEPEDKTVSSERSARRRFEDSVREALGDIPESNRDAIEDGLYSELASLVSNIVSRLVSRGDKDEPTGELSIGDTVLVRMGDDVVVGVVRRVKGDSVEVETESGKIIVVSVSDVTVVNVSDDTLDMLVSSGDVDATIDSLIEGL